MSIKPPLQETCLQALINRGLQKENSTDVKLAKLQPLFEDSSCQVWRCEKVAALSHEVIYIKTLATENKTTGEGSFWLMMKLLFEQTLTQSLLYANTNYAQIAALSTLKVPKVLHTVQLEGLTAVLMTEIAGYAGCVDDLNSENIQCFAAYLAALHNASAPVLASMQLGGFTAFTSNKNVSELELIEENFKHRLTTFFQQTSVFDAGFVTQAEIADLRLTKLAPVMMDMRWDQFAFQEGVLAGIFDLDAFVIAPIELDFVMLEYLLDRQQLDEFSHYYCAAANTSIPPISGVRKVYRTLFFAVNALGETDYKKWMAQPNYFA